jgi:hypothetical protein
VSGRAPELPIIVCEWDRHDRERIRVTLDKFNGHNIVSIRNFYRDDAGEMKPGRGGIAMSLRHLKQLVSAINAALAEAQARGLVDGEGGGR